MTTPTSYDTDDALQRRADTAAALDQIRQEQLDLTEQQAAAESETDDATTAQVGADFDYGYESYPGGYVNTTGYANQPVGPERDYQ